MNKFEIGDWVYNENHGAGKVTGTRVPCAGATQYNVKFNGEWKTLLIHEDRLTKIEHSLRPGHRVRFHAWQYDREGVITRITPDYVDIESDYSGKFSRHHTTVTKLSDEQPKPDLPLPPKFDSVKTTTRTVTTTISSPDAELMKFVFGVDLAAPKPTKRIQESRDALDRQIKDAEAELAKLRAARRAL
ncbi:Hypothetical Protein OBI_RACECAR_3 [Arthrobacter phage Racecar]|nr:hypothetical protein PBI_RACECAR_84 [Arthrobacter phage Racecar]